MPIFRQSSSVNPAALATRSVMPSANWTLSSSVSRVTSIRLALFAIQFISEFLPLSSISHLLWPTRAASGSEPECATAFAFTGCSGPVGAVERAILDGFAQMARRDVRRRIEIGNRSCHLQNPVVCARRKAQPRHRRLQQLLAFGRNRAIFTDQFRRHLRVRIDVLFRGESLELASSCSLHALANRRRILRRTLSAEFLV